MKRLSIGGFTAAGVLVLALGAGAMGGIVGAANGSSDPAPSSPPVTLHQVAEEATAPSATPSPSEAVESPDAEASNSASEPSSSSSMDSSSESATDAADRAEQAADRAEGAAEKAELSVPAPKVEPTTEEEPVAVVQPPVCVEGEMKADPYIRDGKLRTRTTYKCKSGVWVVTGSEKYKLDGGSDEPKPVSYGTPAPSSTPEPTPEPTPEVEE